MVIDSVEPLEGRLLAVPSLGLFLTPTSLVVDLPRQVCTVEVSTVAPGLDVATLTTRHGTQYLAFAAGAVGQVLFYGQPTDLYAYLDLAVPVGFSSTSFLQS